MNFPRTIGHTNQKDLFSRLVEHAALGHAYAFVGPENIGKTTFALELARVLGADPILDVALYDNPAGLTIAEARELQNRLSLTPVGDWKVAIVAGAERMTLEAGNSLLKTLEEPPAHSLLILITANFYSLLPTIASRVQRMNFARATSSEVLESIKELKLDESRQKEIVALAAGRIGLAKSLAAAPRLFDLFSEATKYYSIMEKGSILERLQAAQKLAELETPEISEVLKLSMDAWVARGGELKIAQKLSVAWKDLQYNLNTKLVLDNLFLP